MVRFQCDTCGKLKEEGNGWILGFAAENIGVTSARREISIAVTWDPGRAADPLAVHFCSDNCRMRYVEALFGETPATLSGQVTVTKRRVQRVVPGEVIDTMISEKVPVQVVNKTNPKRKRSA